MTYLIEYFKVRNLLQSKYVYKLPKTIFYFWRNKVGYIMYLMTYIVFFIFILFITGRKFKTVIKSNVLFTGMWCACAGISSLGLYDLYKPSDIIHLYSFTAITVFNIIFLSHNKKNGDIQDIKGSIKLKLIYITHIVCWTYLFNFLIKSLNIISSYGFKRLRMYAFNSDMGFATTLELTIIQWLIQPVFIATVLIATIYVILGRNKQILILIAVIDIIIYTLLFGGRYMLVRAMMYYIFAFLILKSGGFRQLREKKNNIVYIGVIICAIVILTGQRNWKDTSFIKNIILYYTGSFPFLDAILQIEHYGGISNYLFGRATMGFMYNPIIAPFAFLFKSPYAGSGYTITQVTAVPKFISPDQTYNAMTTMLYPFLMDFGYFGIIIGSAFLAWFVSFAENKFHKTNHLLFLSLYVYLNFVLFDSVMSYQLLFPASGITLFVLFLFIKIEFRFKRR